MNRYFTTRSEKEYKEWKISSKATFKKINALMDDIEKNGLLHGTGKPEQLKHFDEPIFSRRINRGDRLVYCQYGENDLLVISCKGHYEDR
ncbi:MAG: Txe/YoeB family addiction module toxin [Defluviitaleaceae bacterium]|nr:Txe/YoeB family addiction module toxin [Defluviitaleaceae bacterium]